MFWKAIRGYRRWNMERYWLINFLIILRWCFDGGLQIRKEILYLIFIFGGYHLGDSSGWLILCVVVFLYELLTPFICRHFLCLHLFEYIILNSSKNTLILLIYSQFKSIKDTKLDFINTRFFNHVYAGLRGSSRIIHIRLRATIQWVGHQIFVQNVEALGL
jgi:hypothetical protein